jgi:hypothetical protein
VVNALNTYGDYSFALNICEAESNINYQGYRMEGVKFYTSKDTSGNGEEHVITESVPATEFILLCYPNPFREKAYITFVLPETSGISIDIYDITGRLLSNLADKTFISGRHKLIWNTSTSSDRVIPGTYIFALLSNRNVIPHMIVCH